MRGCHAACGGLALIVVGCGSEVVISGPPAGDDAVQRPGTTDVEVPVEPYGPIRCDLDVCPTGNCGLEAVWTKPLEVTIPNHFMAATSWNDGFVSLGSHAGTATFIRWTGDGEIAADSLQAQSMYFELPTTAADGTILAARGPLSRMDGEGKLLKEVEIDLHPTSVVETSDGHVWVAGSPGFELLESHGYASENANVILQVTPELELLTSMFWPTKHGTYLQGPHMAAHPEGGIVAAIPFGEGLDLGASHFAAPRGLVVTRLDAHGAQLWSRLVATSPSGDSPWAPLSILGQDERPIAVGSDGTIVLGGPFTGGIDLGEGLLEASHGLFLIKLAEDGTPLWKQAFAGTKPTGWDSSRTGSVFVDDSGVITWFGNMHGADLGFGAHPVGREINPPEDVVPVPVVARFHPCGELMSSQLVGEGLQAWLTPSPSGDFFLIGRHFTYYSGWSKDPAATFNLAEKPVVLSEKGAILSRLRPAGP